MTEPVGGADDEALALWDRALGLLGRGTVDRRSAFHTLTVATSGLDGTPQLRTVVSRAFERGPMALRFHTDRRSAKVTEIQRDPRVAIHGYDAGAKLQIRMAGRATLHADDHVADAAWSASRPMSRVCYGTQPGPGTVIGEGGAFHLPSAPDEVEAGRPHFVAVLCRIETVEILSLALSGHRRVRFVRADAGWSAIWLAP